MFTKWWEELQRITEKYQSDSCAAKKLVRNVLYQSRKGGGIQQVFWHRFSGGCDLEKSECWIEIQYGIDERRKIASCLFMWMFKLSSWHWRQNRWCYGEHTSRFPMKVFKGVIIIWQQIGRPKEQWVEWNLSEASFASGAWFLVYLQWWPWEIIVHILQQTSE